MKIKLLMIAISFALIGALFLSGCNTTAGLGTDIARGGQNLHNAAERAK